MKQIKSFQVNHDFIEPGVYVSRIDGDILTIDMRTRKPNNDDYMDNLTMHSFEHMFATLVRFSKKGSQIVYFGPMGCQTGFYLLVRNMDIKESHALIVDVLNEIIAYKGEVFGSTRIECGNYKNLDLKSAQDEAKRFLESTKNQTDFNYRS